MTIQGFGKERVGTLINEVLSPAHPIRTIQHLRGRQSELDRIERALFADGRHVFVYGDRGVGKSSVAATAAAQYQSSDAEPISVAGSSDATFASIVANIANKALGRSAVETAKRLESAAFEWHGLKWGENREINPLDIVPRIQSVADAAQLLGEVAKRHSEKPVVVIDEFDTIGSADERNKFAHLLKHLGDQVTNLKIIFTGIGSSLDELLGAHLSAHRQLEQVELPRLGWEARREIVEAAADAFGLDVDDNINWRIAIISDGFPYYVHLIMERMLWEAFADDAVVTELNRNQFHPGLRSAIESINAELKRPYQQAVTHRAEFFEDLVWATADGDDLFCNLSGMYQSYRVIAEKMARERFIERNRFSDHVRKLREPAFGAILVQIERRPGWYTYRERMLRGFVRMQAEANGVELVGERPAPRQKMHVPANVRTGVLGPSIPKGVRQNVTLTREDKDK